jgi:hypothetical protein
MSNNVKRYRRQTVAHCAKKSVTADCQLIVAFCVDRSRVDVMGHYINLNNPQNALSGHKSQKPPTKINFHTKLKFHV